MRTIEKYGIIHGHAHCMECNWSDAIKTDQPNRMQALRNRVSLHIGKTGHQVIIETGNSTLYGK